jgi:hypothetical protein
MSRKLLIGFLGLMAILVASGCSKNPSEPTSSASLNLNSLNGGYSPTGEQPAFGDPSLEATGTEEATFTDPMLSSASADSLMNDSTSGWYHFRAIWGHLRLDSAESTVTDWTGKLEINRGALILRRVIGFEDNDHILPRTDPKVIEWVSQTKQHHDGIAVDIFVRRPRPILDTTLDSVMHIDTTMVIDSMHDTMMTVDTVTEIHTVVDTIWPDLPPVELTFQTPPYSRTFTLAELMKLDTIVTLADSNEVAFWGMRFYREVCPRGFLAGNWGDKDSTGLGFFHGRWINRFGNVSGYFRGHYGVDENGKSVFFGKWIDSAGNFEGFLRGAWGILPCHDSAQHLTTRGWFSGYIFDNQNNRVGVLRGKFVGAEAVPDGFMEGRWKFLCKEEVADNPGGQGGQPRGGDDGMMDH